MLDSIYHMVFKKLNIRMFGENTSKLCHLLCSVIMDVIR